MDIATIAHISQQMEHIMMLARARVFLKISMKLLDSETNSDCDILHKIFVH